MQAATVDRWLVLPFADTSSAPDSFIVDTAGVPEAAEGLAAAAATAAAATAAAAALASLLSADLAAALVSFV